MTLPLKLDVEGRIEKKKTAPMTLTVKAAMNRTLWIVFDFTTHITVFELFGTEFETNLWLEYQPFEYQ
jgi:hypothetical protein